MSDEEKLPKIPERSWTPGPPGWKWPDDCRNVREPDELRRDLVREGLLKERHE